MTTCIKTTATPKAHAGTKDAIALLRADHAAVSDLFADYQKVHSDARKKTLVAEICTALSVHAQIEEEIFYPAVKVILKDKLLVPVATVEHAGIKHLITQLEGLEPDGRNYNAKVQMLSEYVEHHVKEEQNDMFPKVMASSLDLIELGARMGTRKTDLLAARNWRLTSPAARATQIRLRSNH